MKLRILKRWPFKGEILLAGSQIDTVGQGERGVKEKDAIKLIKMGVAEEVV